MSAAPGSRAVSRDTARSEDREILEAARAGLRRAAPRLAQRIREVRNVHPWTSGMCEALVLAHAIYGQRAHDVIHMLTAHDFGDPRFAILWDTIERLIADARTPDELNVMRACPDLAEVVAELEPCYFEDMPEKVLLRWCATVKRASYERTIE